MEVALDATGRRVRLVAQITRLFGQIAREDADRDCAERSAEKVRSASLRLAAAAARVVGSAARPEEMSPGEYLRAIGATGALPLLQSLTLELRSRVKGETPATPERADAWGEFHSATRAWDREVGAARDELNRAFGDGGRGAAAELVPDFGGADGGDAGGGGTATGGHRSKHPTDQSVARHWDRWLLRIQGQETHPDVPGVGERIKREAVRERRNSVTLDIYTIRGYLKRFRRSDLYNVSAAVMHYVSEVTPPTIRQEQIDHAAALFNEVVRVQREILDNDGGVQCYPYLIYKIFENIIPPENADQRRILFYIYLQVGDTLIDRDRDWELTCRHIPDLEPNTPTSRSDAARYAPRARRS
jgi:hypothetical protein